MAERSSRWPVIGAFALVGAATQVLWLTFAPVTTVASQHYGVSETAIGWLAQVFPLVYVVLAIPAGMVLDRWFRGGLAAGAILTAAGAAVRMIGDSFGALLVGQIVVAIAQPLVLNAITGIAGRYLAEKDRPAGIAVATASTFAGMVLAFILGALLPSADQLGILIDVTTGFAVVAAIVLVAALVRRPVEYPVARTAGGAAAFRTAWGDKFVRRLCALVLIPFGTFIALTTFAQALLEPAGISGDTASVILLVNVVAGVIGCAVLPVLAARRRRELALLVTGLLVTAVGCAGLAISPSVALAFVAITLIGFLLLPALPVVLELTERRTGEVAGTAAGLIWMAGNLGGLIVATVVGLLVDIPTAAFLLMAVLTLLTVPLLWTVRPYLAELPAVPGSTESAIR